MSDPWGSQAAAMWQMTSVFAARAVEKVVLAADTRVLDIAAGTGTAAIPLAERAKAAELSGAHIVASDISPTMLRELERRAAQAGVADRVSTVVENALALGHADDSFDVAVSVFGLPLLPDPAQAALELARVLRPGGMAVVMWWEDVPTIRMLRPLLTALGGNPDDATAAETRFAQFNSGVSLAALLTSAGLVVDGEHGGVEQVRLPFALGWVAREHPHILFGNPIISKYLASVEPKAAQDMLVSLCEQHKDWAEASANIVVATKPK